MSAKSRPEKGKKGKKGKGKKGDSSTVTTMVIEEKPDLPPFGISALFGTVMAIPSVLSYVDGSMEFDAMILRYLAALLIAWALVNLVYGVAKSFRQQNSPVVEATTIDAMTGEMLSSNTYRVPENASGYRPPAERGAATMAEPPQ